MSNISYVPGLGNLPFGNRNANAPGSFYSNDSQFNPQETALLEKAIRYKIFDSAPAQYDSLKLLFSKGFIDYPMDEFQYYEEPFGRSPIESNAIVGAQAASPGTNQTQVITLTANSINRISPDMIIIYEDGTKGVVVDITGNDITVNSLTNGGLPAVAVGSIFAIQGTIRADGMDYFSSYERLEVIERYNYIQFFLRARRWTPVEMAKYKNSGTTDYLGRDMMQKVKQLRIDFFNSFWNGERGEFPISNGYAAKSMGGIYPTMQAAGAAQISTPLNGLQAAFESTAFVTNFKAEGGTRFIYAPDQILNDFSKIYKQPNLYYEPNNEVANLKLRRIELGTQNMVLVPCELWREESCFESSWARRAIVLDQEAVTPVKMKGFPQIEEGYTLPLQKNGTREDYTDFWVKGQMSIEFNNPTSSFIIDMQ